MNSLFLNNVLNEFKPIKILWKKPLAQLIKLEYITFNHTYGCISHTFLAGKKRIFWGRIVFVNEQSRVSNTSKMFPILSFTFFNGIVSSPEYLSSRQTAKPSEKNILLLNKPKQNLFFLNLAKCHTQI